MRRGSYWLTWEEAENGRTGEHSLWPQEEAGAERCVWAADGGRVSLEAAGNASLVGALMPQSATREHTDH